MLNILNAAAIQYWTSFNSQIYDLSGRKLITSYLTHAPEGDFICAYEEMSNPIEKGICSWQVTSSGRIHDFKIKFADKIPDSLGGNTQPCNCKNPFGKRDRDHKKGCYFTWWNRNCFRWFRKIVALEEALFPGQLNLKYVVWIDADCTFKKKITLDVLDNIFEDNDFIYMKGPKRLAIESGILGIRYSETGMNFINEIMKLYMSGEIFNLIRWDDGYIFTKMINQFHIKSRDIVSKKCNSTRVVEHSLFKDYIIHNKGIHGEKLYK